LLAKILSTFLWIFGAVMTFILYLAMLFFSVILYPFDKQRRAAHAQCYWWSDILIGSNPFWKMKIVGLENIDKKKTYVMVANHQSLADIIVLYQIRAQFKWVAKAELFDIPVLGWCMSLGKHIKLERGDFSSIKKVYREAAEWLKQGMSVLFFPEGTRTETGELGEFQNGAFKLAIKEKAPVLPIVISGTRDAIPKGGRQFSTKIFCTLRVLPAVETASLGAGDFDKLKDEVRSKIADGLVNVDLH
jgi:1-acyl-sn-glycerol-3-phosphate acyltransferase